MPQIHIDDVAYEVAEGRNVLQAALDHRLDLPYFCWHPAMGSVGACRLCAVKHYRDENDEVGRLTMGCMTPAVDGTRVAIDEPEAKQFRRSVIEWLMINHPHDCPVCDEGGECHLQDMTVMTGHAHRRYRGRKRTYRNQYLGPFIHHEMNRCIQCYRCTRFYRDYSGGEDLGAFASRDRVYFGRVEEGVLESPFAGNLVEVCPTGVFTDKTLRRHYTRKWDLQSAPSICTHCSLGCNTLMGARYGSVRRVTSRFNGEVNGYWLCDRGRFGYEHLNAGNRLLHPQSKDAGATPAQVLEDAAAHVGAAAKGALAAVGSPRGSLEANFALRTLATPERYCSGLAAVEEMLIRRYVAAASAGDFHVPSLQQVQEADVIVVVGTDLTNEAPLLDLAAYRAKVAGAAIHVIGLEQGRVGSFADSNERLAPEAAAERVESLARSLHDGAAAAADGGDPAAVALRRAERPLLICGTLHRQPRLLEAVLDLASAVSAAAAPAWCTLAPGEANALGVVLLGAGGGLDLETLIERIEGGEVTTLVVGDNDLFERVEEQGRLAAALQKLEALVVIDHVVTPTVGIASHALPAAAAAECNGTLVSNEGRMQRFYEVLPPAEGIVSTWRRVRDLMPDGRDARWRHVDDVIAAIEATNPTFAGLGEIAPPAGFRQAGQAIPRRPQRYSGRNATLERDALDGLAQVAEDGSLPVVRRTSQDDETPMSFSMEGFPGPVPPALLTRIWSPGWNSNEAINQLQIEVGGAMHGGDPGRRVFGSDTDGDRVDGATDGAATADRGGFSGDTSAPPTTARDGVAGAMDAMTDRAGVGRTREATDFLVCAAAEIFGSEALTRHAAALGELIPDNYVRLHPERGAALGWRHGEVRRVRFSGATINATVDATIRFDDGLPRHVAVVPAGYPATRWWQRPVPLQLAAAEDES